MLEVGQVVDGKYRVERLLGKGGMGAVFEGYHLLVGRRVAIKVILPEVMASAEGIARFEREVRAAARIGSDHVLEVFDVGTLEDGSRFMVSEFLDGETLSDRIDRAPLSAGETARLTLQLLDGLGAAHEAGIVHRDLKPDNIFLLTRKGAQAAFVKIIDFGVSKYQFEDPSSMGMTTTGAVIGTPYYLSPEQARGQRDIDTRSDLYAVGVIMFQMVAGEVPIRGDTFNELLFKIALEPAPPLTRNVPTVDPEFSLLVEKAMAREREARFQTAGELRAALETWLAAQGPASLSHRAPDVASGSSGTAAASAGMPTSSSFGRTDSHVIPRRVPKSLLFAMGIATLAAVGWAARLLVTHADATSTAPSGAASMRAPATESAPEVAPVAPVVAPAEPVIPLAPTEAPPPEPLTPNQDARGPKSAGPRHALASRSIAKPATPAAATPAAVAPPAATPAATSAPAPQPSTTTRKRHDFGY